MSAGVMTFHLSKYSSNPQSYQLMFLYIELGSVDKNLVMLWYIRWITGSALLVLILMLPKWSNWTSH